MTLGPGALLAETLISQLSPEDKDILTRWPAASDDYRGWITGFFAGRFHPEYPMVALSNVARAISAGEVSV